MSRRGRDRKRRRRSRFGLLFKLLCLAAVAVALTAGATVFFRVETVAVTGNSRYSQEEILAASGIEMGDNLYGLNKVKIRQQICTALPYVGELTIRRALPSTIVIEVTEWEAVAQVAPGQFPHGQTELETPEQPVPVPATGPWLISVEGKLLEPAPADSGAILVEGLTCLDPEEGRYLTVPPEQQGRLEALLELMGAMEQAGMLGDFNAIRLGDTQILMRYLDRFDVKIHINDDLAYDLQVIARVRADIESKHGPQAGGGMDLTQEGYELIYSPG